MNRADGELLGIRVEWIIKSEYSSCQFPSLRVELYVSGPVAKVGKNISITDNIADFNSEQLDCNTLYTPRVRAIDVPLEYSQANITDNGIPV